MGSFTRFVQMVLMELRSCTLAGFDFLSMFPQPPVLLSCCCRCFLCILFLLYSSQIMNIFTVMVCIDFFLAPVNTVQCIQGQLKMRSVFFPHWLLTDLRLLGG